MKRYRLKDVVEEISERENNPSNGVFEKFVGLEHYISGDVVIKNFGSTEKLASAMKNFRKGDILIARRNVYLKRASMVPFDGLTSGDSIVLRAKNKRIERLLPFVFNTDAFWDFADKYADGTMSKRLSPKTLMNYEFDLPNEERQDNLAELLWAAEDLREAYMKLLKQLDEVVKSQFIEMFINKSYPLISLDQVSICKGEYGAASASIKYDPTRPRYVRITDINDDGSLNDDYVSSINEQDDIDYKLEYGDFCFARMGATVGKTYAFLEGNQIFAGYLIRYKLDLTKINPRYLFIYTKLEEYSSWVKLNQSGAAQPGINAKKYGSLRLPVPPLDLQNKFATFVHQVDKSKFALQQSIEKLNTTIRLLMQQDFS